MKEIEIESKALLSKEDYEKLVSLFDSSKAYSQTNHYIEGPGNALRSKGYSLRLREKSTGEIEMTLKQDLDEGKLEINSPISSKELRSVMTKTLLPEGEIKDILVNENVDLASLKVITSLLTKRMDASYKGGKLSLDMNSYGDITDYEIELEHHSQEEADSFLKELLESKGVVYKKNTVSKTRRAFEASKK